MSWRLCAGSLRRASYARGSLQRCNSRFLSTVMVPSNKEKRQIIQSRKDKFYESLPNHVLPEDYGPPHEERVQKLPLVYSAAPELAAVVEADVGKFYHSRKADTLRVEDNLAIATQQTFDGALSEHIMIRQSSFDILQTLNEINEGAAESAKGKVIGVHGPRGTGKSFTLHLLAQYGFQNDWLVLTTRGEEFPRDLLGFITPCETREGILLQDRYAREWCRRQLETQGHKLKQFRLKRQYAYSWKSPAVGVEANGLACDAEGVTLHDLFTMATIDTTVAANIVYDIVEELKLVDDNEPKVLVAMDNINHWDMKSKFRDPKNPFKTLDCTRLSMVDAFSTFLTQGPKNGLSVWALTAGRHCTQVKGNLHLQRADFAVGTEIYSDDEFVNAVSHYKAANFINSDVDSFLLARIKGLTGNVPADVFFISAMY